LARRAADPNGKQISNSRYVGPMPTLDFLTLPEKTQTKDIIVRPLGPDRAAMGRSFEDLKNYQRCP